jgi:hypothetical protein
VARKIQAARGKAMSEERLSRLQRIILESLYNMKILVGEKEEGWMGHLGLISCVGEEIGKVNSHPFFGRSVDESFKSAFSQSLRNLLGKGMVEINFHSGGYGYIRKTNAVKITEKGEDALTLTNKLRIREKIEVKRKEFEALQAKVEKLF